MPAQTRPFASQIPFSSDRLDALLDEAGIDVLLATSKHNVQYLLGGHRAFFFDYMDAMGLSRYLPIFVYLKGAPEKAAFFGHRLEDFQQENKPFWVAGGATPPPRVPSTPCRRRSIMSASSGCGRVGSASRWRFLPIDAGTVLRHAFADSEIVDAVVGARAAARPQERPTSSRSSASPRSRHQFDAAR